MPALKLKIYRDWEKLIEKFLLRVITLRKERCWQHSLKGYAPKYCCLIKILLSTFRYSLCYRFYIHLMRFLVMYLKHAAWFLLSQFFFYIWEQQNFCFGLSSIQFLWSLVLVIFIFIIFFPSIQTNNWGYVVSIVMYLFTEVCSTK